MSPYETVLAVYYRCHRQYHWSRPETDEESMDYVMDLIILQDKIDNTKPVKKREIVPMDQVF